MNPTIQAFVAGNAHENTTLAQAQAVQSFLQKFGVPTGSLYANQSNASSSTANFYTVGQLQAWGLSATDAVNFVIAKVGHEPSGDTPGEFFNVGDALLEFARFPNDVLSGLNAVNQSINPGAPPYAFLLSSSDVLSLVSAFLGANKKF